jgi:aspartate racemase
MKTIGLLGGMSWESSALYYQLINEEIRDRVGGLSSAKILLDSVDFAEISALQNSGDWESAGRNLATHARQLENAGADFLLLCTNTMHKVAPAIEEVISIPFLHLGDVAAEAVLASGLETVGLLGTAFTMEQPFQRDRIESHGLTVIVPSAAQRAVIHSIIYEELVLGIVTEASRAIYGTVLRDLEERGAQGIILGCTEIELLVGPADSNLPLFPTTRLHAQAAVREALRA